MAFSGFAWLAVKTHLWQRVNDPKRGGENPACMTFLLSQLVRVGVFRYCFFGVT